MARVASRSRGDLVAEPRADRVAFAFGLGALFLLGCVPSFSGFQIVDDAGGDAASMDDAGVDAARPDAGTDAGTADAGMDAGAYVPTLLDVECPLAWDQLASGTPVAECEGREVTALTDGLISGAVSITRSPDGRVLVAYNDYDFADQASLVFIGFPEDEASAHTEVARLPGSLGELQAVDVELASSAPNVHHMAYWYHSEASAEVRYRTLVGNLLTTVEPVDSTVGRNGALDIALDSNGDPVVVFHDDTSGRNAVSRRRDGAFSSPISLRTDSFPEVLGFGSVGVAVGEGATVHTAYQFGVSLVSTAPTYSFGTADGWMSPTTLDNRLFEPDRYSGVGVDVALVGVTRVVAYLDWKAGVGEVRLARFSGTSASPVIENHYPDIVIDDAPYVYPLELEVDDAGLLHLLFLDVGTNISILLYQRETLVGGSRRWLTDRLGVFTGESLELPVDMTIGPDRRPHIVYQSPNTGVFSYATLRPLPI